MCKVTVVCLTYNHEEFIAEALEGFVSQQAGFPFEVLVHDDASTDGTGDIIREYAARYPDLIKPIFQKENLHSQGINISQTVLFPLIKGDYVALCEGDDCWTDPRKLALQVTALEAHPEADICAHATRVVHYGKWYLRDDYAAPDIHPQILSAEEVIIGGGAYVATSSLLCRKEVFTHPAAFRMVLYRDYSLQIQGALRGGMVWLPQCMSLYRRGTPASWSHRHRGMEKIESRRHDREMLHALDRETGGKYADAIALRCALYDSDDCLTRRQYWRLLNPHEWRITRFQLGRHFRRLRNWFCYKFRKTPVTRAISL